MRCFYHAADLDGHCSGAVVKHFQPDCELIGINYGDEFPWDDVEDGETVFMVGFSLQPFSDMVKLALKSHLIWIDHHVSAIKDSAGHTFAGVQRDGIGACQLCWEYFCLENKTEEPDQPIPYGVKLLAEYDVWNHTNKHTLPFQYAMRLAKTYPDKNMVLWEKIFNDDGFVKRQVGKGDVVLEYVTQDNEKYCRACSFETELDGLRCIAINKMLTNSQVFDSVWDNTKYDAMLTFGLRKGQWTVSLYTDKPEVDVSIIAKRYGGGGHKQAAGFQIPMSNFLPFNIGGNDG